MNRQRGGGLIDVLIAMGVLSGAVAGLARLQAVAFRESADARLRSVATLLARAKLDDLRAYAQLAVGAPGTFGYDEIANDVGGTEDVDGQLRLPAGSVPVDGTRFERSWTSTPLYFCSGDAPPTTLPCTGPAMPSRPTLRSLTVVIAWTDREGIAQRVRLEGSAAALEPLFGAAPYPSTNPS
ncbi:MAG: hypothetical protein K0Q76_2368 [Panacagrimonas sp.]|nr:hypothetical protein [Panacagrimonas sp.]MCC2657260.1 hypothetical protein [Panacagrimonas sp.]